MVVQENVDAIVNLTELKEGGNEKCVPYWPVSDGDESRVNKILFLIVACMNLIGFNKFIYNSIHRINRYHLCYRTLQSNGWA